MRVYHEQNGDENFIPVSALGRRCVSIHHQISNKNIYLSAYWFGGKHKKICIHRIELSVFERDSILQSGHSLVEIWRS